MERLGHWFGSAVDFVIDREAFDVIKSILSRAGIAILVILPAVALVARITGGAGAAERLVEAIALILVLPFFAYSALRNVGDGDFFDGLWSCIKSLAVCAAALLVVLVILMVAHP